MKYFYFCSSQLLFVARLRKVLDKIFDNNYVLLPYKEPLEICNNSVYVVDLEMENSFECLEKIRLHDKISTIFCISCKKNKMSLLGRGISNFVWIDKERDYEIVLEKSLLSILSSEREESLIFYGDSWKVVIPYHEILLLKKQKNRIYFQAYSDSYYSGLFTFEENMRHILDLEKKSFCYYSMKDFVIFFGRDKNFYSKDVREKVIELYLQGVSIKGIHREFGVSKSTIYNWVRQYQIECELKKREEFVKKYLEIEQIVKR